MKKVENKYMEENIWEQKVLIRIYFKEGALTNRKLFLSTAFCCSCYSIYKCVASKCKWPLSQSQGTDGWEICTIFC